MPSESEWFMFIEDHDTKQFAISDCLVDRQVQDWISTVVDEKDTGREIFCQDVRRDKLAECRTSASRNGLTETTVEELVTRPRDCSRDYLGALPTYACAVDRAKLVKFLCKGKCGAVRWGEMNRSFPGTDELRGAKIGDYNATCLRCGTVASDNYNWFR